MRFLRPREVEELLEVFRKSDERQRSHAVRWHHEVLVGNVDEEVDVASAPAPEVVVLDEVEHLARRDAKGQKSNARLKYASSLGRSSLQKKLKSEARQPHSRAGTEAEVEQTAEVHLSTEVAGRCRETSASEVGSAKCRTKVEPMVPRSHP